MDAAITAESGLGLDWSLAFTEAEVFLLRDLVCGFTMTTAVAAFASTFCSASVPGLHDKYRYGSTFRAGIGQSVPGPTCFYVANGNG